MYFKWLIKINIGIVVNNHGSYNFRVKRNIFFLKLCYLRNKIKR